MQLARALGSAAARRGGRCLETAPRRARLPAPHVLSGPRVLAPIALRCCSSAAGTAAASLSSTFFAPPPDRVLLRLSSPAKLLADAEKSAEVVAELPEGELLEAFRDVDHKAEWILVRRSLESKIDRMSEKPLEYQDGWLAGASLERAKHQLGDKVSARIDQPDHPVFQVIRMLPPYRDSDRPLPAWFNVAMMDLQSGKIGGVVQGGQFMVQRPSGAIPERVAVGADMIIVPRQKAKTTILWGVIGFVVACFLSLGLHAWSWMRGASMDRGRKAAITLIGWATFVAMIMTPLSILPCIAFSISQAATALLVVWFGMLLYGDLFSE